MSAPPDRAAARCACTNISLMQLFHELKQKFPGAPDHAVSGAIAAYCHDKRACETHLESQAEASLTHAYHASSSAAARRLKDLRESLTPLECRNRPLETRQFPATVAVQPLSCQKPQNAELSITLVPHNNASIETTQESNENCVEINTNNALVETKNDVLNQYAEEVKPQVAYDSSPITINIDNCVEKSSETPSDIECDHPTQNEDEVKLTKTSEPVEATNYRILKSNKIKSNLNQRLEKVKGKKLIIQKDFEKEVTAPPLPKEESSEKPKRPCTLEFIKVHPELNLKRQTISEPVSEPCRALSPVPPPLEPPAAPPPFKENTPAESYSWPEYPLNLSVNVNVDIPNRQRPFYPDPWLEEYEGPRAFTSVNLTVCTPTSAMQSPVREAGGFEGHLTVTVSPSTGRAPRRPAPPPPATHHAYSTQMPSHNQSFTVSNAGLLARQRERKSALLAALAKERANLRRVEREVAVLRAPPPAPAAERRLRDHVELLRAQCQRLLTLQPSRPPQHVRGGEDARRSPAPSRPAPPPPASDDPPKWQCRVCTFENHGDLNTCEQCDMLRTIELGTTVRSIDSGVGSLTGGDRRLSAPLEGATLLSSAEPVERPAGRACV